MNAADLYWEKKEGYQKKKKMGVCQNENKIFSLDRRKDLCYED